MGCFLSSTKKTPSNSNIKLQTTTTHRSPPLTLPFLEQEQVKEILSETPIIIHNPIIHSTNEKNNIPQKKHSLQNNIHDSHVFKIARIFNPKDELSREPSDMNEKFSRSIRVGSDPNELIKKLGRSIRVGSDTKEITNDLGMHIRVGADPKDMVRESSKRIRVGSDTKELAKEFSRSIRVGSDTKETIKDLGRHIRVGSDSKEIMKDVRQRSPAKYRNSTSPARRSDHLSGSGQIRNNSPSRVGSGKNTGGLSRKDNNGESSCRRSRSPVICGDQTNGGTRNSISRCPSARKSGKSPGRVRSELGDRRRNPAESGYGNRENRENYNNSNCKMPLTSGNNESIENPLVSLECFIFI